MMHMIIFGILDLPWWGYIVATLVMTQITILGVTVFLHRTQAHRAVDLHSSVSHFFRLWLWMTTGMVTKQWTAIHRKHHARVETPDDPHSPQVKGIWQVLWKGAELYRKESRETETMERFGQGTPDDWMERNVYTAHSALGIMIMLGIDLVLFGTLGLTIWAIQMAWIPFFAAGVINGIGHFVGYRNFECQDASRNISPFGLLVGGEELHNNHHTYATSAKFSVHWWEVDTGWLLIRLLQLFGLAKPKRVPPRATLTTVKRDVDISTLKSILTHRFQLMASYSREVIRPVFREERQRTNEAGREILRRARKWLIRETTLVDEAGQKQLQEALQQSATLNVVYQFRLKLQNIWARSTASQKELVEALQEWCHQAESSGVKALSQFVNHLKSHVSH